MSSKQLEKVQLFHGAQKKGKTMTRVEIIGGPLDGHSFEVEDYADFVSVPVTTGSMNGPLGLIPKFVVATLPIHEDGKAYWNERY